MEKNILFGAMVLTLVCSASFGRAGALENISIDENGNGVWIDSDNLVHEFSGSVITDPSGGTLTALVYETPFTFSVQGDYEIYSPDTHELVGLIRFYGNNTIIFYDNDVGEGASLADASGIPSERLAFMLALNETTTGDPAYTVVNPSEGMAGYDGGDRLYTFISSEVVPEPATLGLLVCGIALLLRRRKGRLFIA